MSSSASAVYTVPETGTPPRAGVYAEPCLGDTILDNAKRSVSVRISTSDYGRLKSAAKRLRMRESDIFRHVLRLGLARLLPLLESTSANDDFFRMIARVGTEFGKGSWMDTSQGIALFRRLLKPSGTELQEFDLELIYLAGTHPKHVQHYLSQVLQREVEEASVVATLGDYLDEKYRKSAPAIPST